ncbi:Uncharacterised protein [Mycobacteroides abscessus subsp. abscessus]|nr:Uncharacterised protein [Mycobacteroides abscessus subsp. abscessus]
MPTWMSHSAIGEMATSAMGTIASAIDQLPKVIRPIIRALDQASSIHGVGCLMNSARASRRVMPLRVAVRVISPSPSRAEACQKPWCPRQASRRRHPVRRQGPPVR